ncbi:MAG: DUF1573 domain-containing protein [Flavobacteriaceae bacterium]|jgi:hypothetical protein
MKKILFSLLFILPLGVALAQSGPAISFESDLIDYGEVVQNSDGTRVFKFTNTGDAPLLIKDAKSSCGCTVPKKPEGPIAPGESGEIVVRYDTQNRVGQFRKTITLTTNIENNPMVALKIKGNVLPKSD